MDEARACTPPSAPGRRRARARALELALAGLLTAPCACERSRPWDGPLDGGVRDESRPWLPPAPDASWLADGGSAKTTPTPGDGGLSPSPVGGLWVSCYGGFHPSGQPLRDVTRLGLLCGPPNGMSLLTDKPLEGEVGGDQRRSVHQFAARRGECYRLFAVAERAVTDLDVVVRSSRGSRLTRDHSEDNWPIVESERPFCTFDDDTFSVEFAARRGAGHYAAQVWRLPARK